MAISLWLFSGCASHEKGDTSDPDLFDNAGSRDSGTSNGSGSGGDAGSGAGGSSGSGSSVSGSGAGASAPGDGGMVDGPSASDPLELCGGPCACADGIDNDDDGVTDGFDSECTGAADDDEGSFATGIPGDNRDPKWQDCFFDGNSGAGDDGCRYSTSCIDGDLESDDPKCTVTQQCLDFCKPRTPNGCDCFGCCTFTLADGSMRSVRLEAACNQETWEGCNECVPAAECVNECGRCELCPGKTIDLLPADCGPPPPSAGSGGSGGSGGAGGTGGTGEPPPPYTCDDGQGVCSMSSNCPVGYYCSFGCCQPSVM
ncbi:MAG TPA: hypothetical protein VK509_10715 [Polyangiales bacterium]|nr:hypothetical protein [Polyangiales bacterium]